MALTVAELNTRLTADTRDLQAGLKRAEADVKGFASSGISAMNSFKGAVAGIAAGAAFQQLTAFFADAIKGASDLAEAANATGVAFGQATPQVTAWAQSLSAAFGATTTEALTAAGQFQLVTREAGLTGEQITDLAERAFDLGSVFNQSAGEVSTAIKAGLVGEFEPLRRFGVILSQAKIESIALAQGLIKPKEEMSAGVKQAVIYSQIMKETAFAQGDAENTADAAAGQMRQLRVKMDELKTSIGAGLLPIFTDLADTLNTSVLPALHKFIGAMGDIKGFQAAIPQAIKRFSANIYDLVPGLDGVAQGLRDQADTMDIYRDKVHSAGNELADMRSELIETNAAGGAANSAMNDASAGIDEVTVSAKEAQDALEKLKDAQFAAKDAAFALEDANRSAGEAQDELNKLIASGGVDAEKVKDATEDLARANENLADANERVVDAQQTYNEALADAGEKHLKDVERATEDLTRAQERLADQTQDVADAEAKLAKLKAQKQARDAAIKNAQAQLAAADTVTERIIAQNALSKALGMEVVTSEELAAAQSDVAAEAGKLSSATGEVTKKQQELTTVQQQQPALFDSVKNAADRLKDAQDAAAKATTAVTTAQNALTEAQAVAPGYSQAVEEATRAVERSKWDVEKAAWAAEKAQRAYNQALIDTPRNVTTTVTRNEFVNRTESIKFELPALPPSGSGTVVPLQMRPTLVMHDGGMVPGPRGADVPAILQAGERVIPAGEGGGGGSDQPIVVQLVADGKIIQEILLAHQRRSGALGFRQN